MDWLETTSLSELHTRARPAMFSKVSIGCLALILLAPAAVWPEAVGKTSRKNGAAVREQYLSKSYGEMQFSKYKGQLPTKGSIIECSIECFALTTCHCLGVNVNTNECSFFEAQRTLNMSKAQLAEYMFFTRDNFGSSGSDGFEKVNLAEKGKMTTSHGNTKHKGKGKQQQQPEAESNKNITRPWVQFEFKDPMYITEVQLTTLPGTQLRRFEIRVGNTKFSNEQTSQNSSEPSAEGNALCFEYNERKHFFAPSSTRRDAHVRSIKCQVRFSLLANFFLPNLLIFAHLRAALWPSWSLPQHSVVRTM